MSELSGIAALIREYPWPGRNPEVSAPVRHGGWFADGPRSALACELTGETQLVLELGAWLGLSTRFICDRAPHSVVVTVDHWNGSPEQTADPEMRKMLPRLFESFLTACWSHRERIVPLRMDSREGIALTASYGLVPDLVYIDADHSFEAVAAELEMCRRLFPMATLVGDDYAADSVRRAVDEFARRERLQLQVVGGWPAWILKAH